MFIRLPLCFFSGLLLIVVMSFQGNAATMNSENGELNGLSLSSMQVKVTANGHHATFRLYDTQAAHIFFQQLPLSLELSNFRDAQWMFYPPQRLPVQANEAYHDGQQGELSYYAPWGDVFMLYHDFYAGDEMHRLGISVTGKDEIGRMSGIALIEAD
ncbi:cyclophilin-like fold protein [Celerinatantimonas sp. YJH-8]|uniref:cyclophilin-like fold protein n=1 Tax=Celerinatantimonas sp. YJH-8 TaxID=3228714 RepID=UPI0038BEA4F5